MLDIIVYSVTLVAICLVGWSVHTHNKYIAALAQMNQLQEREAATAELAKPSSSSSSSSVLTTKVVFTLGVMNVGLTCYLLGFPSLFYYWHSVKAIVLISLRWYDFKQKKTHYLLFDFCYWANLLCLLYLYVFPDSPVLFQICFVVSSGPLAWSIPAFSQALVFHKWQNMTSVFIHISPMLLTFLLRWHPDDTHVICTAEEGFPTCMNQRYWDLVWKPVAFFYIWWVILYYLYIFVINGEYIKKKGFQTLYDRVATNQLRHFFGSLPTRTLVKKAIYMSIHLIYGILTILFAGILFYSYVAHFCFIVTMCIASTWNATSHYSHSFHPESDAAAGSGGMKDSREKYSKLLLPVKENETDAGSNPSQKKSD